jgi:hypothetical protein
MRFSNKTRFLIYITVLIFSTYIGYLLGNAFCIADSKPICRIDVLFYISIVSLSSLTGTYVLVNLSEKSITEWNQGLEEE